MVDFKMIVFFNNIIKNCNINKESDLFWVPGPQVFAATRPYNTMNDHKYLK